MATSVSCRLYVCCVVFRAASRYLPVSRPYLALWAQRGRVQERRSLCAAVQQVSETLFSYSNSEFNIYSLMYHFLHIFLLKDFKNKTSPRTNLKFRFDRLSQSAAVRLHSFMTLVLLFHCLSSSVVFFHLVVCFSVRGCTTER